VRGCIGGSLKGQLCMITGEDPGSEAFKDTYMKRVTDEGGLLRIILLAAVDY
jgi:hypothetical protein